MSVAKARLRSFTQAAPRAETLTVPRPVRWSILERSLLAAFAMLLLAAAVLPFDLFLSNAIRGDWIGGDLKRLILLAEVYAHGTGVAMILLTIFVLDRSARRSLLRLGLCAFGAGMLANIMKLYVARIRPHSLPEGATLSDTFVGFLPLVWGVDMPYGHALQSLPSGHTATAVGLAIGMSRIYPHGRWLFATFAGLAALQRIVVGAHYPSDVFCGAAIGIVIAGAMIDARLAGSWLARFERNHKPKPARLDNEAHAA